MNTKYLYKLSVAFLLLVSISSCKKYLDQQPITDVDVKALFKDVPSTYQALVGVYSRLAGQEGYGQRLSLYYTVDTDEMQGPTGTDDERRNIARYQPTPSNTGLPNPFNQLFQGIEYANICISNIPKMDMYASGTEQQKKQLKRMYGEALTLRAQFYFEAIRNWGDLPLHTKPAAEEVLVNLFPARADRDTIYNLLLSDLKAAEDLVPWKNEVASIGDPVDERITKGAVKGIRARIALFRGGYSLRQQSKIMERKTDYLSFYQIAKDECNDIMTSTQHGLNSSYKALWKDQVGKRAVSDPQGELMFQVGSIGGVSTEDSRLGFYDGPRVGTFGNAAINVLPTYFYLFDSLDTRRDVTIAPYNMNVDGITKVGLGASVLNPGKFRRDWNVAIAPTYTGQFLSLKWQILRYADVLLMFAEAENEINGPTVAAYNAINMVRRRGFGKPMATPDATVDVAGLSKADFFNAIVRERSLELGGEGTRKYDLLRWNLLEKALAETKANLLKMSTAAAINPYTYMAQPPAYAISTKLPVAMYYFNNTQADDKAIWATSFYKLSPFLDPALTSTTQSGNYTLLPTDYGVTVKGQTNVVTLPNATTTNGKIYWVRFTPNFPAATSTTDWKYDMRVNTIPGQKIDGNKDTTYIYAGTVLKAATPAVNGPVRIVGFYSNGTSWITAPGVAWLTGVINTASLARFATGFTPGRSELFPIPQPARDANPNLTQNPGY